MESWPVQLVLEAPGGREMAALSEHARIRRAGFLVDSGLLRPGQRIRILARSARGEITDLEILEEPV
ncbi:MAG: hypothetical protein AB7O66_13215 [Limisphaerales bacterium]